MRTNLFLLGIGFFVFAFPYHSMAEPGEISTVAGDGTAGFAGDGGDPTLARLNSPFGTAVDLAGNIYIADYNNHRIRKIDATTGSISTICGTATPGYNGDNIDAASAQLQNPGRLMVDASNNLYIADVGNQRIRKIDSVTNLISTVAGTGNNAHGGDGGQATAADIGGPWGIAMDSAGNLYIASYSFHRIRKVDTSGIITTICGDGNAGSTGDGSPAIDARVQAPLGIAVDRNDNVYICDFGNEKIRRIDSDGVITTFAGTGSLGAGAENVPATTSPLSNPRDVAIDSNGDVYIADRDNHRIRKVSHVTGIINTIAGNGNFGSGGDGGTAISANLYQPGGLGFDPDGNLLVCDTSNHKVRKVEAVVWTYQPDNIIGISTAPSAGSGDDVYNTTGTTQTRALLSRKARTVRGTLNIQNDGDATDIMKLRGTRGNAIFKVTYATASGGNVSAAVTTGSHTTAALAPGELAEAVSITVKPSKKKVFKKIKRRGRITKKWLKKSISLALISTSSGNSSKVDAAKVKVQHK